MLPKQAIEEYIEINEKETGVKLSEEEATQQANGLIDIYRIFNKYKVRTKTRRGD